MKLAKPEHEEILKYQACGIEFAAVAGFLTYLKNRKMGVFRVYSHSTIGAPPKLLRPDQLERLVFDYFGIDEAKLETQLAEAQSYENAMEKGRTRDQTDGS
jgi:hypothetical protein